MHINNSIFKIDIQDLFYSSLDGNPYLCKTKNCKVDQKRKIPTVPIVASGVSALLILGAVVIYWFYKRKQKQGTYSKLFCVFGSMYK